MSRRSAANTAKFRTCTSIASEGFVYLKFASERGASEAQKALHGRWFAGRMVAAEFQFEAPYDAHFAI